MRVRQFFKDYRNKVAVLLAISLVLFISHYYNPPQPLLQYVFLPQIGAAMLLAVVLFLVFNKWGDIKSTGLGPKWVWIPLAVLAASGVLRLLVEPTRHTFAGAMFMASMFGLYLIGRQYGERALKLFMWVSIIGAVSIVIQAFVVRGGQNSGLFNDYATAAQFLVFGWVCSPRKHQWWLAGVVMAGLFCSGAEEAVLYVAGIGVYCVVRRDWSKRVLAPIGVLVLLLLICTPIGMTWTLWGRGVAMMGDIYTATTDETLTEEQYDQLMNEGLNGRWLYGWRLTRPVQPLGHGLDIVNAETLEGHHIPHLIPLLVTDQLGPVAAGAWMVAMIAGIRKTRWKYGFLAVILFGVFQPYIWTEMAPYPWVMAGAATGSTRETSYIFKETHEATKAVPV